jgi:hypothetical protein
LIDPGIAIHDLDGSGYEALVGVLQARDRNRPAELHVLHESGRVVSVVHTTEGPVPGPHPDVADAAALAAELRRRHGVERVVVADADRLAASVAEAEQKGALDRSQVTLFDRMSGAFWTSPGVVADPPPTASLWAQVEQAFGRLPDGPFAVVAGDVLRMSVRVRDGLVVELTRAPARLDATPVVETSWEEIATGLGEDPAATLLRLVERVAR